MKGDEGEEKESASSYFTTPLDEGRQYGCAEALHLAVDDFRRINENESRKVPYCWALGGLKKKGIRRID